MENSSPEKNLPQEVATEAIQLVTPRQMHVAGIDSIRFFLAIWVIFSHGMQPPIVSSLMDASSGNFSMLAKINWLYLWSYNGQAAVIIFFIISGFCIHYPYHSGKPFYLNDFYLNRSIRIGVPLLTAVCFTWLVGYKAVGNLEGVPIWSLYAEGTYYLVYPLLRELINSKRMYALGNVVLLSFATSILLTVFWGINTVHFQDDAGFFYWKSSLLGFPLFAVGMWIAENLQAWKSKIQSLNLIGVRLSAFILTLPLVTIANIYGVGLRFTLLLYAPIAALWFLCEISKCGITHRLNLFEALGKASYSIYLIHPVVLFCSRPDSINISFQSWFICIAWLVLGSSILYFVFEKPSHKLARWLTRRSKNALPQV